MDLSFEIHNDKGDQLMVALSYYDAETLSAFTTDPLTLTLTFYDVTLVRVAGRETVGVKMLEAVCEVLHRFMNDNENAVLCFYCDDMTDISRHHKELTPQEYRSRLFSRMFDMHIRRNHISGIVNYRVKIDVDGKFRFAHFITSKRYLPAVQLLGDIVMEK